MRTPQSHRQSMLDTREVDLAQQALGAVIAEHDLTVLDRRAQFHAQLEAVMLGPVIVSRLDFRSRVAIRPHRIGEFVLLHIPQDPRGAVETSGASREIVTASRTMATVAQHEAPFSLRWQTESPLGLVQVSKDALEGSLQQVLGHELDPRRPLRFALGQDLATPAMRSWRELVDWVWGSDGQPNALAAHPSMAAEIQHMLISGLLHAGDHTYTELLHEGIGPAAPRYLRAAVAYMQEHVTVPDVTVAQVAGAVGIGTHALTLAFREHLQVTPAVYLRRLRLARARRDLQRSTESVTAVAARWGFTDPNWFSKLYRAEYGETPTATRRGH